jgi:hypothetical protein
MLSLLERARKPADGRLPAAAQAGDGKRGAMRAGKFLGLFGRRRSYLLERALTQLDRIADAGLRDLEDGFGDDFSERIGPVAQLQNAQAILIGGNDRLNVLGHECRLLQQAVNRHWGTLRRGVEYGRERKPSPLLPVGQQWRTNRPLLMNVQ